MHRRLFILCFLLLTVGWLVPLASCAQSDSLTFAEAHDAFRTTLTRQLSDLNEIPAPPEGIFDLVRYDTKVGKLAAYVSCDPGDGQKHPLIIWVAGGWSYGIDELAWSYPDWGNDQTGSAFREAGVLMMYPSFRGANGNPGYYEAGFGEIDDLSAAYDYAASLPYVDPNRIYLGGHSTGGTKVLLEAAYTDKFRAVFAFGPVDDMKYHNSEEFTFDTNDKTEFQLRSPIHWLKDIQTPTFIFEGENGNAARVKEIESKSKNEHIQCFILAGADHFSALAPVTRLLANKVLTDTGVASPITLTSEELQAALTATPVEPVPALVPFYDEDFKLRFHIPAIWKAYEEVDGMEKELYFISPFDGANYWDASTLYVDLYISEEPLSLEEFNELLNAGAYGNPARSVAINGMEAFTWAGVVSDDQANAYYSKVVTLQGDSRLVIFWFYTPVEYQSVADALFENVMGSITLEPYTYVNLSIEE